MPKSRKYHCYHCHRYVSDVVKVIINREEKYICIRCHLSLLLHDTIVNILKYGTEEDLKCLIRVLEGINDLVEANPLIQAIIYVIDRWSHKYPQPLYLHELMNEWKYKVPLQKVLNYLSSEGIFEILLTHTGHKMLSPGYVLRELLKRYSSSREFFENVVKIITGLAIVAYLVDPESLKLRMIYATLQAINACIDDKCTKPYYEIKGYRCKLCEGTKQVVFASKDEARKHALEDHFRQVNCDIIDEECFNKYFEILTGRQFGVWCRYNIFVEKASVYGVRKISRFLRYLLVKRVIVPLEGDEIVKEIEGDKYIAVDFAWIKIREYMRQLDKELIRGA
jgi:hypothetical protein